MAQVADRAGAMLDDPGHRRFSTNYLRAHIDQQNESFMVDLETMGVQQQEATAIFNIPANTTDLTPYFASGQPLQSMLRPVEIQWKLQGQPDTGYNETYPTKELLDVDQGNIGCQQYKWAGGSLQITPSSVGVTLRVQYLALTATVYDSNTQMMRGVGFIIAGLTAGFVCSLNNGMGTLQQKLQMQTSKDIRKFKNLMVMQQQGRNLYARSIRRTSAPLISAGGSSYS